MNRNVWILAGIVVFVLAAVSVMLGMGLVPPKEIAQERGTVAGWWLVWTVIWMTVLSAVTLGVFLVAAGVGMVPETRR
jgi:uncharacterized membrane protein